MGLREVRSIRGITLVHVLIVLIVFVAFGVVFGPTLFGRTIIDEKRPTCITHLKQCAVANIMYLDDNDGVMPAADHWMDQIFDYCKSEELYHDSEGIALSDYGYAFRKSASKIDSSKIVVPYDYILIFDSVLHGRNATGDLNTLPLPGRHYDSKGDNVVSLDAHARALYSRDDDALQIRNSLARALTADRQAGPK